MVGRHTKSAAGRVLYFPDFFVCCPDPSEALQTSCPYLSKFIRSGDLKYIELDC